MASTKTALDMAKRLQLTNPFGKEVYKCYVKEMKRLEEDSIGNCDFQSQSGKTNEYAHKILKYLIFEKGISDETMLYRFEALLKCKDPDELAELVEPVHTVFQLAPVEVTVDVYRKTMLMISRLFGHVLRLVDEERFGPILDMNDRDKHDLVAPKMKRLRTLY